MTDFALVVLRIAVLAAFATLAARSYRRWRRNEAAVAAGWLSASFAVMAAVTVAGIADADGLGQARGGWPWKVTAGTLMLFPYCLSGFTATFRPASRRRLTVCRATTTLVVAWTFLLPAQPPGAASALFRAYVATVIAHWTVFSLLAGGWLWSSARREPAVARRRMRTLGAGALLLNFALLARVAGAPHQTQGEQIAVQVLAMASGWLFFVGFTPPRPLKAWWRQGELSGFHRAQGELIAALDPESVGRVIVTQAVRLLGTRAAFITAADGRVLATDGIEPAEAVAVAATFPTRAEEAVDAVVAEDSGVMRISLRGGWLAVQASNATPFFEVDENELLQALCHSAGLALERAELFERDRTNRNALQQRESQLAQAQRLARVGSWAWHIDTGAVVWSAEMYRLYDLESVHVEASADYGWFRARSHPDDAGLMEAAVRDAIADGGRFELSHRIIHRDGGVRWLHSRGCAERDESGNVVRLQGTAQEITATKESEEQLRAVARQQAALAELGQRALHGSDMVALFDDTVAVITGVLRAERAEIREGAPTAEEFAGDGRLESTGSSAVVVIPGGNRPFGVLAAGRTAADAFGPTEIDFLTSVANILAAAVQRSRTEAALAYQALHDPLTGLPNRALLLDRLAQAAARAAREPTPLAVLFLDLDRFKVVNDGLGHRAGDDLLKVVADRLVTVVRPGDTVARLGGDEFVVLCENLPGEDEAALLAERIAEVLERPVMISGREVSITASVGIVLADAGMASAEELLRDADTAMYQAKEGGRARFALFDAPVRKQVMERLETEVGLRRAVERGELRLCFQPEVSLHDGRVVGLEALLRWEHPERGLLLPGQFLWLAEETGLVVPIGEWALAEACRVAGELQRSNRPFEPVVVWVNLSGRQLVQPGLPTTIARILAETGADPTALGLEITESVIMEDTRQPGETLRTLKRLGLRIAIDDFGTGFSSLSRLRRFPVDVLKVDRSFVAGMDSDEEDTAIVQAVVGLAHSLGMTAIAEGVESPGQQAALRQIGCDAAQGFSISPPLDAESVTSFLLAHTGR